SDVNGESETVASSSDDRRWTWPSGPVEVTHRPPKAGRTACLVRNSRCWPSGDAPSRPTTPVGGRTVPICAFSGTTVMVPICCRNSADPAGGEPDRRLATLAEADRKQDRGGRAVGRADDQVRLRAVAGGLGGRQQVFPIVADAHRPSGAGRERNQAMRRRPDREVAEGT